MTGADSWLSDLAGACAILGVLAATFFVGLLVSACLPEQRARARRYRARRRRELERAGYRFRR